MGYWTRPLYNYNASRMFSHHSLLDLDLTFSERSGSILIEFKERWLRSLNTTISSFNFIATWNKKYMQHM